MRRDRRPACGCAPRGCGSATRSRRDLHEANGERGSRPAPFASRPGGRATASRSAAAGGSATSAHGLLGGSGGSDAAGAAVACLAARFAVRRRGAHSPSCQQAGRYSSFLSYLSQLYPGARVVSSFIPPVSAATDGNPAGDVSDSSLGISEAEGSSGRRTGFPSRGVVYGRCE